MRFKVIDKMFISGFFGPYIVALFVVEFVLIMQYLWKVIDDILGNGYGIGDYLELVWSFGLALLPMALPLTVLLSSVMTYGDKAEKYEIVSMKSAGVSLNRMFRPGLLVAIFTMMFSIVASNYLKPYANKRYHKKIRDMKTNKLTFVFDEKVFNQEFKNFSIRVDKIDKDGRNLEGVLIYDHNDNDKTILNMVSAKTGEMYITRDGKYLVMDLKDGYQIKEVRGESSDRNRNGHKQKARPVNRVKFERMAKSFELAKLLNLSVTNLSNRAHEMMNSSELMANMDSLAVQIQNNAQDNIREYRFLEAVKMMDSSQPDSTHKKMLNIKKTITKTKYKKPKTKSTSGVPNMLMPGNMQINVSLLNSSENSVYSLLHLFDHEFRGHMIDNALKTAESNRTIASNNRAEHSIKKRTRDRFELRLHQQYSWAVVCLIFLFIGAPAGALIRKGGFGYPLIIATVFYVTFVMLSIAGERMSRTSMDPVTAAWLPCIVLLPFAIFLTMRAINDVPLIDIAWPFRKKQEEESMDD